LLQNGARPSGALIVRTEGGQTGSLSDEQFQRIRQQIDEQFAGPENAGRPLLLEGGLEWKEMSLSPRDMDFISVKNSAARDIALAFGVPPQLLGIPGDNTYSNLQEARYALWEQTVIPMAEMVCREMSQWLAPHYGAGLELRPNPDGISAIGERNQALWQRVENASFLTENEKRAAVGYPPLEEEVS
jgi:HK97 family phage portal protein